MNPGKNKDYKIYTGLFLSSWSMVLIILLGWNFKFSYDTVQEIALYKMRLYCSEVLESRAWSDLHAGVFHRENNRDIVYAGDNPGVNNWVCIDTNWNKLAGQENSNCDVLAAVLKQNLHVRVTSRSSTNPANLPDTWELTALDAFDNGATEAFLLTTDINQRPVYRYIAPLNVDYSCTSCHKDEQYLFKKFNGGISIISPAEPMLDLLAADKRQHLIGFGIVWLLGCGGIVVAMRKLMANNEQRIRQEKFIGVMEMAGAAAHELNQPLQVITSCSDMMLSSICERGAYCAEMGARIKESVNKLASITRKINRITRYVTTEYAGHTRIIDLEKAAPKLDGNQKPANVEKTDATWPSSN